MRLDHVTLRKVYELRYICSEIKLLTSLPDDNSNLEPPDPISNSEVKRVNANGSAGSPCVRVGNRQAFLFKGFHIWKPFLWDNIIMIIGLTGGIGSGKSIAAKMFTDLNIDVIDADLLAKKALNKNSIGYEQFLEKFGNSFLNEDSEINRLKLRNFIFSDNKKKSELEEIIHPIVAEEISKFIDSSQSPYSIIMVPLIYETRTMDFYEKIIVIDCDLDTQLERAAIRDDQKKEEILAIIESQASRDERNSIADDIILNNSSIENLRAQVEALHKKYIINLEKR